MREGEVNKRKYNKGKQCKQYVVPAPLFEQLLPENLGLLSYMEVKGGLRGADNPLSEVSAGAKVQHGHHPAGLPLNYG